MALLRPMPRTYPTFSCNVALGAGDLFLLWFLFEDSNAHHGGSSLVRLYVLSAKKRIVLIDGFSLLANCVHHIW